MTSAESIRCRASMYIGRLGPAGVGHLLFEVVANSVDQFLAGQASEVVVEVGEDWFSVSDDGPGLPIEPGGSAFRHLTEHHMTPTADKHLPHMHFVPLGVGIVVVNELAERIEIKAFRDGNGWRLCGGRGELDEPEPHASVAAGTCFTVWPDAEILNASQPNMGQVRRKLFDAVHLIPGLKIRLNEETFHAPGGLSDLAAFHMAHQYYGQPRIFRVRESREGLLVDVSLAGSLNSSSEADSPAVYSWVNGSSTAEHGSHVNGVRKALKSTEWQPQIWLVHVMMESAEWDGRTRNKLGNPEAKTIVSQIVTEALAREDEAPSNT